MRIIMFLFLSYLPGYVIGQVSDTLNPKTNFTTTELLLGKTLESNTNFPQRKLHKTLFLNFGTNNLLNPHEWAYRLGFPKTGMSFAISDFGNGKQLGYAVTAMPFTEFNLQKKHRRLKMLVGIGAAYLTKRYDSLPYIFNNYPEVTNRTNKTRLNWSFRLFFNYILLQKQNTNWKLGVGFFHQSNGHTQLPNQGLNSFVVSIAKETYYKNLHPPVKPFIKDTSYHKNNYWFVSFRSGIGQMAFSERLNDRKLVYNANLSTGKVFNNTLKIGLGFYYRFYEVYYDYIKMEEDDFIENYAYMTQNAYRYSTNYGVFATSELLLGNFAINVDLGYNIYKPFYEVQWKYAEGFYWQTRDGRIVWIEGVLDKKYNLKRQIMSRMGLYYYFINTSKQPKHNIFIGAHINANLGQADFSEFSIGYCYKFGK